MATEASAPPASGLPEATTEIVASLAQHRVLTTEQVREIHLPDNHSRWAQQVLGRLRDAELVAFTRPPNSGQRLWFATERGVRLAREAHTLEGNLRPLQAAEVAGQLRAHGHTDPTFTLRVYTHLMSRDPDERMRLKALVRGERVIAREAPEPQLLDLETYEQPILQALAGRGGRASRSEIIAALAEAMASQHSARDLEPAPLAAAGRQGPSAAGAARMATDRQGPWLRVGADRPRLDKRTLRDAQLAPAWRP